MDKYAVLKAEIERRIAEYDKWIEEHPIQAGGSSIRVRREELASLKENFIDALEEPDKSLKEAARRYALPTHMKDVDENSLNEYPYDPVAEKAFIAGAKWAFGQRWTKEQVNQQSNQFIGL